MELEPCFMVYNLIVIQLNSTKLGQLTNLKVILHMVVSVHKLDKICNLTQSPAQPQNFTVVYSVTGPMNGSEAAGDLVLIQTLLFLSCKSCCCDAN